MTVQTIEKTGKRWKAIRVIALLPLALAMLTLPFGYALSGPPTESAAQVVVAIGWSLFCLFIAMYLIARIGAWWYHG